jgi:hypothetical protein
MERAARASTRATLSSKEYPMRRYARHAATASLVGVLALAGAACEGAVEGDIDPGQEAPEDGGLEGDVEGEGEVEGDIES